MYKVLLVDDEPIIVEGLSRSVDWEKLGCQVVGLAYDGKSGKNMIEEIKPDIVLMDISMPEMSGLEMIAALGSEYPNMQVSVLTGFREFNYAQQAIRLGITRYLLKPSNMADIEEAFTAMVTALKQKGITGSEENAVSEKEKNTGNFVVENAIKYMEEHYREKISLAEVAEKTYVSQWHLSKLLNVHKGSGFLEIINEIRIRHAKELLLNPSLRIGDISEMVGFTDFTHFSRTFKKVSGMTANEYRNSQS